MLEAEMLKKVVPHSVATALASSVLPVPGRNEKNAEAEHTWREEHARDAPGGPYSRRPFQGDRMPVNNCGYLMG
jgi:hypothetical protein